MQSSPAALFHIDAPIQESGRFGRAAGGHDVARIVELHVHRQFAGPRQLNRLARLRDLPLRRRFRVANRVAE